MVEERISDLEGKSMKIIQIEKKRVKRMGDKTECQKPMEHT